LHLNRSASDPLICCTIKLQKLHPLNALISVPAFQALSPENSTRWELRYTTRLDPSSALFGSLREKRLELRHNLGVVAVRALNALLFVLTDRHRKGETS
jgi:hypothetical protein